jgi:hypothetical protein
MPHFLEASASAAHRASAEAQNSTHRLTSGLTNIGHTGGLSKQAAPNSLVEVEEMRRVKWSGKCTTKLTCFVSATILGELATTTGTAMSALTLSIRVWGRQQSDG